MKWIMSLSTDDDGVAAADGEQSSDDVHYYKWLYTPKSTIDIICKDITLSVHVY